MNEVILCGVIRARPEIFGDNVKKAYFEVCYKAKDKEEPTLCQCVLSGKMTYVLYTKAICGTVILLKGKLVNGSKGNMLIQVEQFQIMDSKTKYSSMGINEFLEIYKPEKAKESLKNIEKEQKKNGSS